MSTAYEQNRVQVADGLASCLAASEKGERKLCDHSLVQMRYATDLLGRFFSARFVVMREVDASSRYGMWYRV